MRPPTLIALTVSAAVLGTAVPAHATPKPPPVPSWIERNATPLATLDPRAPLTDLAHLRRTVGDATIVGLGESTHGSSEQARLKHRMLRVLVEQMGFRSIAWEEDWTLGLRINDYILKGTGDPAALLRETDWRSQEVLDVLHWLRDYNKAHAHDPVRFFGIEYYATRPLAYDAVAAYVAEAAPGRLPEVRRHLDAIRPWTSDMGEYVRWFWKDVADKQPYVDHARAVHELVGDLPGGREHQVALHHARQIRSFYEHFSLKDNNAYRDEHTARNLRWWRSFSRTKIAYWAAAPHTANAPRVHITAEPDDIAFASVGSFLRRWYGKDYRSIGFTFDRGAISGEPDGPALPAPRPRPGWVEQPLGQVRYATFTLDLRRPAPPSVHKWMTSPATTRGLIWVPGSVWTGGNLRQWYDALVHRQVITPQRPL